MGLRAIVVLWALLASAAAQGEQLLREVVQHAATGEAGGEAPEVEILLGVTLTLAGEFHSSDGRAFTARLEPDGPVSGEWQFTELRFDEPGYDIERVTLEGSAGRGFELTVHFDEAVHVATLPQYAGNRVALKYLDQRAHQRAVARSANPREDGSQWVVELAPAQPLLHLAQMPRALVLNRILYLPPGTGAARLGFFSRDKARSVLAEVRGAFPGARVMPVTEHEAAYGQRMRLNGERLTALFSPVTPEPAVDTGPKISITAATTGTLSAPEPEPAPVALARWDGDLADSLLRQAKDAYIAGDYDRAVGLYTEAAELPAFRLEALEMLGVTREQTRQLAQAKRAYETALAEFPDAPEADRIRARLQALVTIDVAPRKLRKPEHAGDDVAWQTTALLSQFYRRYSVHINRHGTTVPIDGLFSDVDLSVRRSSGAASHEGRISLGHILDFSDDKDGRDLRVQSLYWESSVEKLRTALRAGRQTERRSGVLGRFDGISASYAATPAISLQALGGYLVDSSFDEPQGDRPFWGVNAEIRLLDDSLSLTPFYVQQRFDGVLDRQAVGMQGELYTDRGSYFGMVDYDLHHEALNHALLSANLRIGESTRVYGSVDHRRSPYLTTRNALIGQPVENLSELELLLLEELVEDQLEDIAADRSAVSTMVRLGVDKRFGSSWTVSLDSSLIDFGATDSSFNVTGLEAHEDVYLSAQVRSENAFGQGNYGALQMRYLHSDSTRSTGAYFNNRLALREHWWLYPRLAVDQRRFDGGQTQLRLKPSLRLDYRYNRRMRVELEVGYEWTTRETVTGDLDMSGLFIVAGYRAML